MYVKEQYRNSVAGHFSEPKTSYPRERVQVSGLRYYRPRAGRWVNRDPIWEWGGLNLYALVRNQPIFRFDRLGLAADCCSQEDVLNNVRAAMTVAEAYTSERFLERPGSGKILPERYYIEFCGNICCDSKGKVYMTGPVEGEYVYEQGNEQIPTEEPWNHIADGVKATCPAAKTADDIKCDDGDKLIMFYHSHPRHQPKFTDPDDYDYSKSICAPIVVGAPGSGFIIIYYPCTGEKKYIKKNGPKHQ